jgi:hypothetical protein
MNKDNEDGKIIYQYQTHAKININQQPRLFKRLEASAAPVSTATPTELLDPEISAELDALLTTTPPLPTLTTSPEIVFAGPPALKVTVPTTTTPLDTSVIARPPVLTTAAGLRKDIVVALPGFLATDDPRPLMM